MKPRIGSLLTVKEAAARLSELRGTPVSARMVRRATQAKKNRIPTVRMGKYVYVADLDGWLERQIAASEQSSDAQPKAEPAAAPSLYKRSRKSVRANDLRKRKKAPRFGVPARGVVQFPSERRTG